MAFELQYSADAVLHLEALEKSVARRIVNKLDRAKGNPHQFFKRLVGRPEYKLRVGDYRVIAELDTRRHVIFIRSVGNRRDIYR
ncbi:MAG: type II toxin-antitoxin system RelE/ParE family toxin [Candidatus Micrarchaeota archaeon]|nr:type II toxin-antitoxin system RelE/ParE family toxin [Candidatus Micrarchaeota archaeon]